MKQTRRSFVKTVSITAAAIAATPARASKGIDKGYSPLNQWPGRVVVNYNGLASKGIERNEPVIRKMVDDSILLLTGKNEIGPAWQSIFPVLTQKTRIAIKVNLLNPVIPSDPVAVSAVVEGLKNMQVEGKPFPAANIAIYDGFNHSTLEKTGYTPERFPGITITHHVKNTEDFGDGPHDNQPYMRTLKEADYLINVPGIRGHADYAGNVTMGFKSHYGTFPPKYHDMENGPGYIRDINCTGPVFKKTVLTVFTGLWGLKEGNGPKGNPDDFLVYSKQIDPKSDNSNPNTLIMSTDPVSAEVQGITVSRMRENKPFDAASMPHYLKASAGIEGALSPVYNIGVIEAKKMDVRKIVNGVKV